MAEEKYYVLEMRIPCDAGGCWVNTPIRGIDLTVSTPQNSSRNIEYKLKEINEKEYHKLINNLPSEVF